MKDLYSSSILLNHRGRGLPLISRHSRKETQKVLTNSYYDSQIQNQVYLPKMLQLCYCQWDRVGRFPPKYWSRRQQDQPHGRDNSAPISNTHTVTFRTLYSCLECLPHNVLPYDKAKLPIFIVSNVCSWDWNPHKDAQEDIQSNSQWIFPWIFLTNHFAVGLEQLGWNIAFPDVLDCWIGIANNQYFDEYLCKYSIKWCSQLPFIHLVWYVWQCSTTWPIFILKC